MKIRYQFFVFCLILLFSSMSLWGQSPAITVNPQFIDSNVPVNGRTSATITIGNTGSGDLNWNIFEDDPSPLLSNGQSVPLQLIKSPFLSTVNDAYQPIANPRLPKGAIDARVGASVQQGFGGPDAFGYMFIDSDEPGGPEFSFQDLRNEPGAITLPLGDDDSFTLQLPFNFPFYGENKSALTIGSNGYITFDGVGNAFQNTAIPDPADPNDMLAPFWDDLDPSASNARVQFFVNAATREVIVQYSDGPLESSATNDLK